MGIKYYLIVLLSLLISCPLLAVDGRGVNVYLENDSRRLLGPGSDSGYTSGLKISYIFANKEEPGWVRKAIMAHPFLQGTLKEDRSNFSFAIGQQIFTPSDIESTNLITDDRPYAAWLYAGISANFKNEVRAHILEVDIGYIGPEAGGQQAQNSYHRMLGEAPASGWEHQLQAEATLQFSYQQRIKSYILRSAHYGSFFDVVPYVGAAIGNVNINAYAGGLLRFGKNLPDNFGPTKAASPEGDIFIEPEAQSKESLYLFAGGRGTGVLRNIFLDGNTFKCSASVTKRPFVLEGQLGVSVEVRQWIAAWSYIIRSPEFEEREEFKGFASVSLTYNF